MKNYNVVVLGASGSGKTVYLSALFHKLSTPSRDLGYFIKAPDQQEKHLHHAYATLCHQWLEATLLTEIRSYNFDIMVRGADGRNHHATRICCYDMAGERQTDVLHDSSIEEETSTIIANADVLMGLIDGQFLLQSMAGSDRNPRFWNVDVQALCTQMIKSECRDKSLYFILTKWDCYDDVDSALAAAKVELLSYPPFANLIESCVATARIIPVSSVGRAFAEKLNGGQVGCSCLSPVALNVEVPFACILPDVIATEVEAAQREIDYRVGGLQDPVVAKLRWWERVGGWLGDRVCDAVGRRGVDTSWLRFLAERARASANRKVSEAAEQTERNREEARRLKDAVRDHATAARFVLESMASTLDDFERRYPSSVLK